MSAVSSMVSTLNAKRANFCQTTEYSNPDSTFLHGSQAEDHCCGVDASRQFFQKFD